MMAQSFKVEPEEKMEDAVSEMESAPALTTNIVADQVKNPETQRRLKFFHEMFPDAVLKFPDNKEIAVSRIVLALKSRIFEKIFTEFPRKKVVYIEEFDHDTFNLFLNVLVARQDCTAIDALLIFPIAWEYEAEKVIEKCLKVLKPTELNENVCLALNISLFCKCEKLTENIMEFFCKKRVIFKLLKEEKYYFLLEPESLTRTLEKITKEIDSEILKIVFKWGKHYLEKKNKSIELRPFFEAHGIAPYLNISCFETISSFIAFDESNLGIGYFTNAEFRDYLKRTDHKKSKYVEVKAEEIITEEFEIKNVLIVDNNLRKLKMTRNRLVFYEIPENYVSQEGKCSKKIMLSWFVSYVVVNRGTVNNSKCKFEEFGDGNFNEKKSFLFIPEISKTDVIFPHFPISLKIKIKYKFWYDARILKTSSKRLISTSDDQMFFVADLEVMY